MPHRPSTPVEPRPWSDRAATAALVFSVTIPLMELWRIQAFDGGHDFVIAAVLVALYLPLHVRHLFHGLHARMAPGGRITLALMFVIMISGWVALGADWVLMLASLAVSVLVTLPVRVSLPIAAAVVLSPLAVYGVLSRHGDLQFTGSYLAIALLFRSTCLFVVIWLVAASRRLRDLRAVLAEVAVLDERKRMQDDLRQNLKGLLGEIAERARWTDELVQAGDPRTASRVRDLIGSSRSTLTEVKRIVDSYQRVSARSELEAAAALLTVAGVDAASVRDARNRGEYVRPEEATR